MATHYVYDNVDKATLRQGDVLRRDDNLVSRLREYFPYYAKHEQYKYFIVLTQSCDLMRRQPGWPYITVAAVRPVEDALHQEADKWLDHWQRETKIIDASLKNRLSAFLGRLLDNNEPGYFYLHEDRSTEIHQNCCAFLPLSVTLRAEHYECCLAAKIAQLTEPFQAKLGWLIGHMFSRVGTTEWNTHYRDNKVPAVAKTILDRTFVTIDDQQIREGLAELKESGTLASMLPEQIRDYILKRKVVPRKDEFEKRAFKVLREKSKFIGQVGGRVQSALRADEDLANELDAVFKHAGLTADAVGKIRESTLQCVLRRLGMLLSDAHMPGREDVLRKMLATLLQDPIITKIIR